MLFEVHETADVNVEPGPGLWNKEALQKLLTLQAGGTDPVVVEDSDDAVGDVDSDSETDNHTSWLDDDGIVTLSLSNTLVTGCAFTTGFEVNVREKKHWTVLQIISEAATCSDIP